MFPPGSGPCPAPFCSRWVQGLGACVAARIWGWHVTASGVPTSSVLAAAVPLGSAVRDSASSEGFSLLGAAGEGCEVSPTSGGGSVRRGSGRLCRDIGAAVGQTAQCGHTNTGRHTDRQSPPRGRQPTGRRTDTAERTDGHDRTGERTPPDRQTETGGQTDGVRDRKSVV